MLVCRLAMLLVPCLAGCVRASWGTATADDGAVVHDGARLDRLTHDGLPLPGDGPPKTDRAPLPLANVTAANDDCSSPAVVDLGPLAAGQQVSFTVNTSGAKQDYDSIAMPGICGNSPDVVVQLVNAPTNFNWRCAGAGQVAISNSGWQEPCGSFANASSMVCGTGNNSSLGSLQSQAHAMICHDWTAGTITITMMP